MDRIVRTRVDSIRTVIIIIKVIVDSRMNRIQELSNHLKSVEINTRNSEYH